METQTLTLLQLVDQAIEVVGSSDRDDLATRLRHTRARVTNPGVRVLVVGEFKQGKSQLVNALVGASVCPVDDDIATSVSTVVRHADSPTASLVLTPKGDRDPDDERPLERREIPLEKLAEHVSEAGNPGNEKQLVCAEVGLPRTVLGGGLTIVDTPGVGGLGSVHAAHTMSMLPTADVVLLVSDAGQEYSEPEIEFLRQAMKLCPNVACVLTKIDLYPQWRRIAELDRVHLNGAGVEAELLPVSSNLRLLATRNNDTGLNEESGFPALIRYLRESILGQQVVLGKRSVSHDILTTTEHLSLSLRTELDALQDPERTAGVIAELEGARTRADELRKATSRWGVTLNDGTADLASDVEHDLRDRVREITREAEAVIDDSDPALVWDQFTDWLDQQVAGALTANFVWSHQRSQWLARQVANHFAEAGRDVAPDIRAADVTGLLDNVVELADVDDGRLGVGQKVLIGMRGSYGGVLMIGLATALVGMALINPISIAAGAVLGARAYKDEKKLRLKQRQNEAKMAVRKHTDDVIFKTSKVAQDRLRQIQRLLRDHFTEIAEELHRSLTDSVSAAQKAAATHSSERDQRIRELKKELERIKVICRYADALMDQTKLTTTA